MKELMKSRIDSSSNIAFNKNNMIFTEKVLDDIFDRGKEGQAKVVSNEVEHKNAPRNKMVFQTKDSYDKKLNMLDLMYDVVPTRRAEAAIDQKKLDLMNKNVRRNEVNMISLNDQRLKPNR